jgi:serine/threonine protein kinase
MTGYTSEISAKTPEIIAPVYRTPELLHQCQVYGNQIDIWAFGCVLFEMTTQRPAFKGEREIRKFMANSGEITVFDSDYGEMNEDIPMPAKWVEGLIIEMLQLHVNRRPSADSVLEEIDRLLQNLKKHFNQIL